MRLFKTARMRQNRNFGFVLLFGFRIRSRQNGPDRVKSTAFSPQVRKPTFDWNHAKTSHTLICWGQKLRIIIHSPMTSYNPWGNLKGGGTWTSPFTQANKSSARMIRRSSAQTAKKQDRQISTWLIRNAQFENPLHSAEVHELLPTVNLVNILCLL